VRALTLRSSVLAVLALVAGVLLTLAGTTTATAADRDCSDFSTQAAAQRFYVNNGGPHRDPHRLDADNDGRACDSLPCPCSSKTGGGGGGSLPARITQYGKVTKVVDGDTVDVRLTTGKVRRVRMIGIDTPEVYGGTECGGPKASASMKALTPVGTRVKLVSDRTQDRVDAYGRILRYVIKRSTGRDLNRAQVARGWARVYVYNGNPFERVAGYRSAQSAAKAAPRGIWKVC
jgi:endonuclease YncB( thermonuclease family)